MKFGAGMHSSQMTPPCLRALLSIQVKGTKQNGYNDADPSNNREVLIELALVTDAKPVRGFFPKTWHNVRVSGPRQTSGSTGKTCRTLSKEHVFVISYLMPRG